jgi:hypothetical protein
VGGKSVAETISVDYKFCDEPAFFFGVMLSHQKIRRMSVVPVPVLLERRQREQVLQQ